MTPMSDEIMRRLMQFVAATFANRFTAGEPLAPTTPLFSTQVIDSMGLIELLAFIEREFEVSWDATLEELMRLDTPAQLAREIAARRQAQEPA